MDADELLSTAELPNAVVDTDRAPARAVRHGRARRRRRLAVAGFACLVLVAGSVVLAWSAFGSGDPAQVSTGSSEGASPSHAPQPGDAAVWTIDAAAPPSPQATSFVALVTRLGCNSGVTGNVLGPRVVLSDTRIVVTFTVEADLDGGECPSNDLVPYEVDVGEPIGDRSLIDGSCRTGSEAARTSFCIDDGGVRWHPDEAGGAPREDTLPGERLDRFPADGAELAVVGVAVGDVLHVRSGPGTDFDVVVELAPLAADMVASGHNRQLDDGSVWAEVDVGGVLGWVNAAFTAHLGPVVDITADVVAEEGPLRAEAMLELADAVVASRAGTGTPGEELAVVIVDGPTAGDPGDVVVDVLGYPDDSGLGVRLRVLADHDGGGFTLRTVEATSLCRRGASEAGCL